jgi:hypothetical protein
MEQEWIGLAKPVLAYGARGGSPARARANFTKGR